MQKNMENNMETEVASRVIGNKEYNIGFKV